MEGGFRMLDPVRQCLRYLPEVHNADRKVPFKKKVMYTVTSLLIFLVCSRLPLYGMHFVTGANPLYWMHAILTSNRGTVMELGITPILTSGVVMQTLALFRMIVCDDRVLLNGAQKLLGIIIAVGGAVSYVLLGMYGSVSQLGVGNSILITVQLCFASIIMIYLDELLQKGYGFGSGISLFIAADICENAIWKAFSPMTINNEQEVEFEGAIIALLHLAITKTDKIGALWEAFYRQNLPNMTNLFATVLIFPAIIYFLGFHVFLPVQSKDSCGKHGSDPIKLFYTFNMPIIHQPAVVSSLYFMSRLMHWKFNKNLLFYLFGKEYKDSGGRSIPLDSLAYYFLNFPSVAGWAANPFNVIVYLAINKLATLFSTIWVWICGPSRTDVVKQLKEQQLVMTGDQVEDSQKELIYSLRVLGFIRNVCVFLLIGVVEPMEAIGSGAGILLAVTIIYQYFESFEKERASGLALVS